MMTFLLYLDTDADKAAFLVIYENNMKYMFEAAKRVFRDQEDKVEEAVQEALAHAAKNFSRISSFPCEEITPYLVTTTKNVCMDMLRKERKYAPLEEEDYISPADATPHTAHLRHDYRRAVEVIGQLPEIYRRVLECRMVLELSNKQTAKLLHIKESTASMRFERARERVEEQLKKEGIGAE